MGNDSNTRIVECDDFVQVVRAEGDHNPLGKFPVAGGVRAVARLVLLNGKVSPWMFLEEDLREVITGAHRHGVISKELCVELLEQADGIGLVPSFVRLIDNFREMITVSNDPVVSEWRVDCEEHEKPFPRYVHLFKGDQRVSEHAIFSLYQLYNDLAPLVEKDELSCLDAARFLVEADLPERRPEIVVIRAEADEKSASALHTLLKRTLVEPDCPYS